MAKGYWIAHLDVENEEAYAQYRALNGVAFKKFGARFVVRGPAGKVLRGTGRRHNVVLEFDSYEQAVACYDSPEYQAALPYLKQTGPSDFIIVGGYDGPQPA